MFFLKKYDDYMWLYEDLTAPLLPALSLSHTLSLSVFELNRYIETDIFCEETSLHTLSLSLPFSLCSNWTVTCIN